MLLIASLAQAAESYIKVDDYTIRCVKTTEKAQDYTIGMLDYEIQGCEADIVRIEESKAPIQNRLDALKAIKAEAETLKIKEKELIATDVIEIFDGR